MAGTLHVELVSADRVVWSGEAVRIIARTVAGDVGILPGHAPLLSLLSLPLLISTLPSGVTSVVGGRWSTSR